MGCAVKRATCFVDTSADVPAPAELVFGETIESKRVLVATYRQTLATPDQFRARLKPFVNGTTKRTIAKRRVKTDQPLVELLRQRHQLVDGFNRQIAWTGRHRHTEIKVGSFSEVAIRAQTADIVQPRSLARLKHR